MSTLPDTFLGDLQSIVGDDQVITKQNTLQHGSRDCYWFSPVLKAQLDDKVADVIVRPSTVEQLVDVIALAVKERVPITPHGAGTGNYGQAVPLQRGLIINTKNLNSILELTPNYARVQAGVILHTIELEARNVGAELRFFPSTLPTATAGGFLAGGSGGVGSITWGNLWDEGNVLGATVVTIEDTPQIITLSGPEALQSIIHNCGLTCIIADLTFALAPVQPWQQYVVAFDTFEQALRFGEQLAYDEAVAKRLITAVEWPVPTYFKQLMRADACPEGKSLLFLHLTLQPDEVQLKAQAAGGLVTWHSPQASLHKRGIELTDFTWNHTTLWAIKADPQMTYLQDSFDPQRLYEQLRLRKDRYGDTIYEHIEFMKSGGEIRPAGLSLVRYQGKDHLWELMEYCESIGIVIANPHTTYLDEDVRWNGQPILDAKARWDPYTLLNPGHLKALEK
ncbi:MAG: FAD-binding oxidoreductase [Chloroflexota bacterium]